MNFTKNDFRQTEEIAKIIQFCDGANNKQLEEVVDDIYQNQPFLISFFLRYRDDVST
ncbi:MAG: hypothetical protein ACI9LN_003500 [Saprospiraceae bacterium]|jgi:hypothetical protein